MWHGCEQPRASLAAVLVSNLQAGCHQQEKGPCHLQDLRAQSCFVSFLCLLLEQQLQVQLLLSPTTSFVGFISQNSSCLSLHWKSNDYAGTFPEKLTSLWCGTTLKKAPLGPCEISTWWGLEDARCSSRTPAIGSSSLQSGLGVWTPVLCVWGTSSAKELVSSAWNMMLLCSGREKGHGVSGQPKPLRLKEVLAFTSLNVTRGTV